MLAHGKKRLTLLLRWSERYTKIDMVYVTQGGFWVTLGQVISNLLSLGLLIAFANLLPPETYGLYRYILSLAGVLGIFSLSGMNAAVARAVAQGHEGALRASVHYQYKWNLMMAASFGMLALYYWWRGDELFALSFVLLGLFVPATLALNTYGAYLEGKREFKLASLTTIGSTAAYTFGMLAILYWSSDVLALVAVYAGSTFVATLFSYWYTLRRFHPTGTSGGALEYGRTLTFISFVRPIAGQIDKILLTQFWGTGQLATYAIVTAVVDRPATMIKSWIGLAYPKLADKTTADIHATLLVRLAQGALAGALAAGCFIFLSPFLFAYVLPRYAEAVPYANLLAISMIINVPGKYLSIIMQAQRMVKELFALTLVGSIAQILLYGVLGIWGGIEGLVIAYLISSALALIQQIIMWYRHVARSS